MMVLIDRVTIIESACSDQDKQIMNVSQTESEKKLNEFFI